jgi:DNA-binding LacI/PurR family transcriptional regulator
MRANIDIVAKKCGVSKGTVSRAFTGRPGISDAVKRKIHRIAKELNYTPQQVIAQENIAIITDYNYKSAGPTQFYSMLLADLVADITRLGYLVKIIWKDEFGTLMKCHTKVAVLMITSQDIAQHESSLKELGIPMITVNQILPFAHSVCLDHFEETQQAVEHLFAKGHRKIALALDNSNAWGGQERLRGYKEAMKRNGLSPLPHFSYQEYNFSMLEVMAKLRKTAATAAIILGESLVPETAYAINLLGISVPEELSIITSEQKDFSKWLTPPHTTIDQNIDGLSNEIAGLIEALTKHPETERIVKMLKARLLVRQSVKEISGLGKRKLKLERIQQL